MKRSAYASHLLLVTLFASAAGFLPAARAQAQQVPSNLQAAIARIDAMAAEEYAKDNAGSVTVGIVHGPHLIWTRSYGNADAERKIPATRDTVYRIGSITKQFTALMLLQLAQDGKVSYSDPVERFLPEVNKVSGRRDGAPPITLMQLATMTAGMGREPANLAKYLVGPVAEWEQTMISALGETKYDYEPGTRFYYSNIGYAVLGAALGRAAKLPFTTYVEQRIFQPLGMTHTAFEPNAAIQAAIAKGYEIDRSGRVTFDAPQRDHAGRGYKVPNGAIYTTVADLARFIAFELGEGPESVLKKESLREQQSRAGSASGQLDSGYGVGFQLRRRGEHVFLGHGGSVAGYTANAWIHAPSKTGLIVLRSAAGGQFDLTGLTFRALTELANAGTAARRRRASPDNVWSSRSERKRSSTKATEKTSTRRHGATEDARRACGPPAYGGPDERGQPSEYKRLMTRPALVVPAAALVRAARSAAPQAFSHAALSSFEALLRASSVAPCLRVGFVSVIFVQLLP